MNIPEIYLVEPYNAYAPKGKTKHWHQVIEEQELMHRIAMEQIALQEASSKTLPPNSPATSTAVVGNMSAGAGGQPVYPFFHPEIDVVNFDRTPANGDGPLTVVFTNLTTTPQLDKYLWTFGDGTTSTEVNPTHVYQSGSSDTGIYTASLQVTNSITNVPGGRSPNVYISASKPTVTANFTSSVSTGSAPLTVTFINRTVDTSQTPNTTYLWTFGSGSATSTETNPTITYFDSGSYTVSLQAVGSYTSSVKTQLYISATYNPFFNNLSLS